MQLTETGAERIKLAFVVNVQDPGAKLLLIMLAGAADDKAQITLTGHAIARLINVTRPTVLRYVRTLEGLGLISRTPGRPYRPTRYTIAL